MKRRPEVAWEILDMTAELLAYDSIERLLYPKDRTTKRNSHRALAIWLCSLTPGTYDEELIALLGVSSSRNISRARQRIQEYLEDPVLHEAANRVTTTFGLVPIPPLPRLDGQEFRRSPVRADARARVDEVFRYMSSMTGIAPDDLIPRQGPLHAALRRVTVAVATIAAATYPERPLRPAIGFVCDQLGLQEGTVYKALQAMPELACDAEIRRYLRWFQQDYELVFPAKWGLD